jgi:hypothetical protein
MAALIVKCCQLEGICCVVLQHRLDASTHYSFNVSSQRGRLEPLGSSSSLGLFSETGACL